jgi:hypothetical protein
VADLSQPSIDSFVEVVQDRPNIRSVAKFDQSLVPVLDVVSDELR